MRKFAFVFPKQLAILWVVPILGTLLSCNSISHPNLRDGDSEKETTSKELTGKVVGITDGDTFTLLLQDSTTVKIRLASIDCPERKQPFYARAKQFASEVIFGKQVRVAVQSKDRYRRYIGTVYYGRKCLNEELLSTGFAWHFRKYSKDEHLQQLEDMARRKRRGLWIDKDPIPPWEWRAR